jgi:putative oxidoreductase
MALAMFLLRVVVGLLFVGHGTQKLFGWFGGHGIEGTSGFMRALGYRPARQHAVAAGLGEALGGALLFLGWFTPFAAAAIVAVMVNAIATVHGTKGPWVTEGGYEYNVVLIAAAVAVASAGPGGASLDGALGWDLAGPWWGVLALLLGFGAAAIVLSSRRPELADAGAETDLRAQEAHQVGGGPEDHRAHRRAA